MGKVVNVRANLLRSAQHFQDTVAKFSFNRGQVFPELSKFDPDEGQPLAEVIVKFPGDAGAFFLLGADQASCQVMKRYLGVLSFRDVDTRANVSKEGAIGFE